MTQRYENLDLGIYSIVHGKRKKSYAVSVHDSDMPEGMGIVGVVCFAKESDAHAYARKCVDDGAMVE